MNGKAINLPCWDLEADVDKENEVVEVEMLVEGETVVEID